MKNKTCPFCGENVYWLKVDENWELFSALNVSHVCKKRIITAGKYDCDQCDGFGVIESKYKRLPCYKCLYEVL